MADTKTYLKVPYRDGTVRALPFNGGHLTALVMAKQLRSDEKKLNASLRVLNRLLGDDTYEQVTNDLVDGETTIKDLMALLEAIVTATAAYNKAQEPDALQDALDREEARQAEEPPGELDPGTGGE
jgi:hypothetical protein